MTGGTGFIGANLVRILLEEGVSVRVFAMRGDPATNLVDVRKDIEIVEGDLLEPPSLQRAVEGCDTLFHLAAIYAIWLPRPRLMFDVNVEGTRNIMDAARKAGIQRIVHTSSIAAVGHRGHNMPSDEDCHFNEWDTASDYVMSKYISELEVHRLCNEGLPAVIVNPCFPFGWGDVGPTPTGDIIRNLLKGSPVYLDGGFNAVNVADVARGHWLAALRGQIGRRYILGGDNLTYFDFAQQVARIAGVRAPRWRLPASAAISIGRVSEWVADNITHAKPIFAEDVMKYTVGRTLYFDISRARDELGYDPTPVEQAIREAVDWFRQAA